MSIWKPINCIGAGYSDAISEAIDRVQQRMPTFLLPVDDGLQIIASDYSGQHQGASHEIFSFVITTINNLQEWLLEREDFRSIYLTDGRRLSFKQLREPMRQRAYVPFLEMTGNLRGNLITIAIDNRVGSFIGGGPSSAVEVLDDCFDVKTPVGTVEKILRLASFVALITACLRKEDQPSWWVSDRDETLDSFEKRERFAKLATYLTYGLTTWRKAADFHFLTTEHPDLPYWAEDFAAIPDIAAGAFAKLCPFLPTFLNRPAWMLRGTPGNDIDWRARLFADWFALRKTNLKQILVRVAPDERGEVRASAQTFLQDVGEWKGT